MMTYIEQSGTKPLLGRRRQSGPNSHAWLAALVAALVVVPLCGYAQAISTGAPVSASVMVPHRTPADTGRMTWGHQDYSRYTTADACDRAAEAMSVEIWRTHARDTMPYAIATDTLATATVAAARACAGTRFPAASADQRELWSVLRLAFDRNDDAQARQAVDRQLSLVSDPADRGRVLSTAIQTGMGVSPPRVTLAREWLGRLDALGAPAQSARYDARIAFLRYWHLLYTPDSLLTTADSAIAIASRMTADERDEVDVFTPYAEKFWVANIASDFATQQSIVDSGLSRVGAWRSGNGAQWFTSMASLLSEQKKLYGKTTRALTAPHTYNDGGHPRPRPGTAALIVHADAMCGTYCYSMYTVLRQLHARTRDSLDIVLATETKGYAPGSGPLTPADEAALDARYFIDFLKLPAALIIDDASQTRRPDGRIIRQPSPIGRLFAAWQGANAVLVDREGKVRWLGVLQSTADARIVDAAVGRLK